MCVCARTSVKHEKNHLSGVADRNPLLIYSPIVDTNVRELIQKEKQMVKQRVLNASIQYAYQLPSAWERGTRPGAYFLN